MPFRPRHPADELARGRMRSSCVVLTALVALAAYYTYTPLPSTVSDPWKLMLLDAVFRGAQQAVRRSPALVFLSLLFSSAPRGKPNVRTRSHDSAYFSNAGRQLLFKVVQSGLFRVSHSPACEPRSGSVSPGLRRRRRR